MQEKMKNKLLISVKSKKKKKKAMNYEMFINLLAILPVVKI